MGSLPFACPPNRKVRKRSRRCPSASRGKWLADSCDAYHIDGVLLGGREGDGWCCSGFDELAEQKTVLRANRIEVLVGSAKSPARAGGLAAFWAGSRFGSCASFLGGSRKTRKQRPRPSIAESNWSRQLHFATCCCAIHFSHLLTRPRLCILPPRRSVPSEADCHRSLIRRSQLTSSAAHCGRPVSDLPQSSNKHFFNSTTRDVRRFDTSGPNLQACSDLSKQGDSNCPPAQHWLQPNPPRCPPFYEA